MNLLSKIHSNKGLDIELLETSFPLYTVVPQNKCIVGQFLVTLIRAFGNMSNLVMIGEYKLKESSGGNSKD